MGIGTQRISGLARRNIAEIHFNNSIYCGSLFCVFCKNAVPLFSYLVLVGVIVRSS